MNKKLIVIHLFGLLVWPLLVLSAMYFNPFNNIEQTIFGIYIFSAAGCIPFLQILFLIFAIFPEKPEKIIPEKPKSVNQILAEGLITPTFYYPITEDYLADESDFVNSH